MVRIILSKAIDEEKAGDKCDFYCTPEEICRAEGREIAAKRVKRLFDQVKKKIQVFLVQMKKSQLVLEQYVM